MSSKNPSLLWLLFCPPVWLFLKLKGGEKSVAESSSAELAVSNKFPIKEKPKKKFFSLTPTCGLCGVADLGFFGNQFGKKCCPACALNESGLSSVVGTEIVFSQIARYRDGVSGCVKRGDKFGHAIVLKDGFAFVSDGVMSFGVPWSDVKGTSLDFYMLNSFQAFGGAVAQTLQQTKNCLVLKYMQDGVEWDGRFDIYGAKIEHGHAAKAAEVMNHISQFRGKFLK